MLTGNTLHGFTVIRMQQLRELGAVMYQFRHNATGLEAVWLKRPEENKTFGIAFKTLPDDDTGVFHILEHSVLCGSDRFPIKEPFVELMKSSMNTFLNAMTFSDRTFYPISSRNAVDFMNLTRVYLDAVFHPLIYSKSEIFAQEGWHYEFATDGSVSRKGVVYNEMRGLFADVDELSSLAAQRALFPDTPYRYESGGHPEHIPELTYEQFIAAHRRCYSPSNAYVYLDGDLDIDAVLKLMDEEYLRGMSRGERIATPAPQKPVSAGPARVVYELSPEEPCEERYRLLLGRVIGSVTEREKLVAMQVLATVLCGDNQAPLTRAVLDEGLAEAVTLWIWDSVQQPWARLEVRNLREENLQRVRDVLTSELTRLASEGLDRARLTAAMANLEFQMRERDYGSWPQGLMLGLNVLDSWMRDGAPEANLEVGRLFDVLKSRMDSGYFEQLIREVLLNNPHSCEVIMVPSHEAGAERAARDEAGLKRISEGWSEAERAGLVAFGERLNAWQQSEDSPEALAGIPRLRLEDLSAEPEAYPCSVGELAGVPLLRHELAAGGISYITLYFDVTPLSCAQVSRLSAVTALLGKLSTAAHSAEEISRMAQLLTGSMNFSLNSLTRVDGTYTLKLAASVSVLEANAAEALRLLGEVLCTTSLGSEREALNVLRQVRTDLFQGLISGGHNTTVSRVAARITAASCADECATGVEFYRFLKAVDSMPWAELSNELSSLLTASVNRRALTVSVTGERSERVDAALRELIASLPEREALSGDGIRPWPQAREGIEIPGDVGYAALGMALAAPYAGDRPAAARAVSLSYLWNAVRVQGGAYGTGMITRDTGLAGFYSFRDPDAARTLGVYAGTSGFLRRLAADGADLTSFITGAIASAEPLLTARMKGSTSDMLYFRGISDELRRERRRELLGADCSCFTALADALDAAAGGASACVLARRDTLEACALDSITAL